MERLIGHYCPSCKWHVLNSDSISWKKKTADDVTTKAHHVFCGTELTPLFEKTTDICPSGETVTTLTSKVGAERLEGSTPSSDTLPDKFFSALIEQWIKDPDLSVGVPYRRMASEASDVLKKLLTE